MGYNEGTLQIVETDACATWFDKLRDRKDMTIILARFCRVELGNLGDCEPVSEGIREIRIHLGPRCRIYTIRQGLEISNLLAQGDKSMQ